MVTPKAVHFWSDLITAAGKCKMELASWLICLKRAILSVFPVVERSVCGGENQGPHSETDVIRALPNLWGSDRGTLWNCIQGPCAPSHTEIENFPQPRLWKRGAANDNSRFPDANQRSDRCPDCQKQRNPESHQSNFVHDSVVLPCVDRRTALSLYDLTKPPPVMGCKEICEPQGSGKSCHKGWARICENLNLCASRLETPVIRAVDRILF